MQILDWVNIGSCIFSLILATVSVVTVVITLRQNHKMIENATRPYIAISYETICPASGRSNGYIIVKNYGQSTAHVDKIHCTGIQDDAFLRQFGNLQNSSLAPGQRRIYYLKNGTKATDGVTFSYEYRWASKQYSESTTLRLDDGSLVFRSDAESYALQEIAERML